MKKKQVQNKLGFFIQGECKMIERLEKVLEKYNELKEELVKPENLNDYNK